MEILSRAFGALATNCYIAKFGDKSVVIDPGQGSFEWICENAGQILAVINTHGHFDHVWDNFFLQKSGAKIYIHKDDAFMIEDDPFGMLKYRVQADMKFNEGKIILGCDLQTKFLNSCANKFNPNFNQNLVQNKSATDGKFSFNTQILKQNSDINLPQNSCNFGDKTMNLDEICTQNSQLKRDEMLDFIAQNGDFEAVFARFGDMVYEYELEGKIEILGTKILIK